MPVPSDWNGGGPNPSTAEPVAKLASFGGSSVLEIAKFPEEVRPILSLADHSGDGHLDSNELKKIFKLYTQMKEAQTLGHVAIAALPFEVQDVVSRFDLDKGGTVSPIELARAADMYERSKGQARRLVKIVAALFLVLLISLAAVCIMTYGMIEASKEQDQDPTGLTFVKGSSTPVAKAEVAQTKGLFDAPLQTPSELKKVTSLMLSDKTGNTHFAYTITGFTKEASTTSGASVTFYSARGDKIKCTANKISVTAKCTPQDGASGCTGRLILELGKEDVANSRRLLQEMRVDHASRPAGRRLSSSEIRRLQAKGSPTSSDLTNKASSELVKPEEEDPEFCEGGMMPKVDGSCPQICTIQDIVYPEDCPQDGTSGSCPCPEECPAGEESCTRGPEGKFCLPVYYKNAGGALAEPCQPACANWRDPFTGECMALCGDPAGTEVMESDLDRCPVECPDLSIKAEEMGLDVEKLFGKAYAPEWRSPTDIIGRTSVSSLLCPQLCPSGHIVHPPNFECPRKCTFMEAGVEKPMLRSDTGAEIYVTGDEQCPRFCAVTGTFRSADYPCPIYCPDSTGNVIWDAARSAPMVFQPLRVEGFNDAEIRAKTCPEICPDGSVDTDGVGCTGVLEEEASPALITCPGAPTDCKGNTIQKADILTCPTVCPSLRDCKMELDGLIWPGSDTFCPVPCYDGTTWLRDSEDKQVFNYGQGCPQKCPAQFDGTGTQIELNPSRRLSSSLMSASGVGPKSRRASEVRKLQSLPAGWSYPPANVCTVFCLDTTGSVMFFKNEPVTTLPVKMKSIDGSTEYAAMQGDVDELRSSMCPLRCPDLDNFLIWPKIVTDSEGFSYQSMAGKSTQDCPRMCTDGRYVYPKYGETCEGTVATAV